MRLVESVGSECGEGGRGGSGEGEVVDDATTTISAGDFSNKRIMNSTKLHYKTSHNLKYFDNCHNKNNIVFT